MCYYIICEVYLFLNAETKETEAFCLRLNHKLQRQEQRIVTWHYRFADLFPFLLYSIFRDSFNNVPRLDTSKTLRLCY